jgi:2-polyprenyl-6-methoxyphenol hydroxylase-like FAD-dependent oxidoreductase
MQVCPKIFFKCAVINDFNQRRDLLRILYNAAVEPADKVANGCASRAAVTVVFNVEVIEIDSDVPFITVRSGETYSGDAIIGADGAFGVVRKY